MRHNLWELLFGWKRRNGELRQPNSGKIYRKVRRADCGNDFPNTLWLSAWPNWKSYDLKSSLLRKMLDLIEYSLIWGHLNSGKYLTWLNILWFKVISTWENTWLDWVFSDLRSSQLRKMLDLIECSLDLRSSVNRCECKEVSEMYRFPRKPVISKSPTHFLLLFAIKSKGLAWFG